MTKTATLIAGMDIGDRFSYLHVLDAEGEMLEETRVPTTPRGLRQSFESRPALRIAIEEGPMAPVACCACGARACTSRKEQGTANRP